MLLYSSTSAHCGSPLTTHILLLYFSAQWFAIIISCNNFLQIINCTVNYIIYFGHCWRSRRSRNGNGDKSGDGRKVVSTVSQNNVRINDVNQDPTNCRTNLLCNSNSGGGVGHLPGTCNSSVHFFPNTGSYPLEPA